MLHDAGQTWDAISAAYQARQPEHLESPSYGPWSPPEQEVRLLGDVRGWPVLDLGCGGGQNAVALAELGAVVTAIDISAAQLAFARQRAAQAGVAVTFVQGAAETLAPLGDSSFRLIFSANVLPYVADLPACLAACRRVLQPGGRLIFSLDHPVRACFFDADEDELSIFPVRSYFAAGPYTWRWPDRPDLHLRTQHHTIAQWIDLLAAAGFWLRRLVEPPPVQTLLDDLWPEDGALAPLRCLPQTAIFVAEKE